MTVLQGINDSMVSNACSQDGHAIIIKNDKTIFEGNINQLLQSQGFLDLEWNEFTIKVDGVKFIVK